MADTDCKSKLVFGPTPPQICANRNILESASCLARPANLTPCLSVWRQRDSPFGGGFLQRFSASGCKYFSCNWLKTGSAVPGALGTDLALRRCAKHLPSD